MSLRRFALASIALGAAITTLPVPAHTQAQNPCVAAVGATPAVVRPARTAGRMKYGRFGNDTRDVRDLLHLSNAAQARVKTAAIRAEADRDENNIAILEDNGELITPPNLFDLANKGLRFSPGTGSYAVSNIPGDFRQRLGRQLTLGDDDSSAQTIDFPFDFYGKRFTSFFVNSDGNLTFEEADSASTERGAERLSSGAPRIAPFFADLDPSSGGGVFVDSTADATTVTWCAVPAFDSPLTMTVQATLFRGGTIEYRFGAPTLMDGLVGVSPGHTESFFAVDLTEMAAAHRAPVAFAEIFASSYSLDMIAAAKRFYATHPDDFDQLVFWTEAPVLTDAFAFQTHVKNVITGTGLDIGDFSAQLGSAGTLQSIVNMDRIAKYGDSPSAKVFGENSALGILAHETGHRWLTRIQFIDHNRQKSDALLGRQRAHWSFFADTDGSVMEGNEIQDLGGGTFRTGSITEKYSRLDMYAMGLATAAEVPPWFYVESPLGNHQREDGTIANITFNGTRRNVLIQDVIDALGPRVPAAAESPRVHRQAYIFVRRRSAFQNPQDIARLSRIRQEFVTFFNRATEGRMTLRTTLQ
ncbi:MAG TPA: hypothetical protein VF491_12680 [Vicinamibacterales bacterium]